MDRQMRIAVLTDHFKKPRHRGGLEGADVVMPGGNPGCGDVVELHVRTDGDGIGAVSFEGTGCTISQAAASILCERVNRERPSFQEILDMSYESMIDLLGRDIVGSRPRCATLALGTLKAAVKRIDMDRRLRESGRTEAEIQAMRRSMEARSAGNQGLVFGDRAREEARP